jgi:hypothetical protein
MCFKNVRTLPYKYTNDSNAWITSELFKNSLASLDAKMSAAKRNILQFIGK